MLDPTVDVDTALLMWRTETLQDRGELWRHALSGTAAIDIILDMLRGQSQALRHAGLLIWRTCLATHCRGDRESEASDGSAARIARRAETNASTIK